MGKLYIFRGKAATGKSVITDLISKEFNICVLRKDDIYDMLDEKDLDHASKNRLSYNILAKMINTNLKCNCDLIVDIGLANPIYLNEFLDKIDLSKSHVKNFLCICSDEEEWKRRIELRILNPTPNQLFTSADDAIRYYRSNIAVPIQDEIVLDSSEDILDNLEKVKLELKN
jgi:hypothetical protein